MIVPYSCASSFFVVEKTSTAKMWNQKMELQKMMVATLYFATQKKPTAKMEPEDVWKENLLRGRGLGVFLCDEGGRWKEGGGIRSTLIHLDTFVAGNRWRHTLIFTRNGRYFCCRKKAT